MSYILIDNLYKALYACLQCTQPGELAGMCLACSLTCHKDCELVELYTKRDFRCDCGTDKFRIGCELNKNKDKEWFSYLLYIAYVF